VHSTLLAIAQLIQASHSGSSEKTVTDLSDTELDIIATYTGMSVAMHYPLAFTPIVFFGRNDRGAVKFVTVLKDAPIGSASVCKWEGLLV